MNVAGQVMLRRGLLPTKNESQGERDLRVGVVGPIPHPTEGGASSLLETLVEELKVTQSRHVFIPLKLGEGGHSNYLRMRLRATWFGDMVARGFGWFDRRLTLNWTR
jgi:hypothetical protein